MEDGVNAEGTRVFKGRPGGTKAAKEDQIRAKQREAAVYAQAAATDKMAEAQMLKAVGLQDQNMLLLMTTDDATLANAEAREYIQLRRVEELRKLRRRLAEENEQELVRQADCARRVEAAAAAAEEVRRSAVGELRGGVDDLRDCLSDSQEHGDQDENHDQDDQDHKEEGHDDDHQDHHDQDEDRVLHGGRFALHGHARMAGQYSGFAWGSQSRSVDSVGVSAVGGGRGEPESCMSWGGRRMGAADGGEGVFPNSGVGTFVAGGGVHHDFSAHIGREHV